MNIARLFSASTLVILCLQGIVQAAIRKPRCPKISLENGRIRYRQKTGIAEFTCSPGYFLVGQKFIYCLRGSWLGDPPICITNTCKKPNPPANGSIYFAHSNAMLHFFCHDGFNLTGTSHATCNGKQWSSPMPSCIASHMHASLTCDFEREDLCGWSHDLNHDFDWTRHRFSTLTGHIYTGPSGDHTPSMSGKGYYMYIEATARLENDTARLISPVYPKQTTSTCLEFYYHMYGASAGQLRVYLKKWGSSWEFKPEDAFFWKTGDQGAQWHQSFNRLPEINEDFQIVVEAVRGSSYLSDLAIDDVTLTENCTLEEETESYTSTYWTDMTSYESLTCENRCGMNSTLENRCNCTANCSESNSCCPDFIAICISGNFFTDEVTTMGGDFTTDVDITVEAENYPMPRSAISSFNTTEPQFNISTDVGNTTLPPTTIKTTTKATTTTLKFVPTSTTITTSVPTTTAPTIKQFMPTKVVTKAIINSTKPTLKPSTKPTFNVIPIRKLVTKTILKPITQKPTTARRVPPYNFKPPAVVVIKKKTPKESDKNENELLPRRTYSEQDYITLSPVNNKDLEQIVVITEQPVAESHTTVKSYWAAIVACLVFTTVISVFLWRRFHLRKLQQRRHYDSQSDVRFLTSDELLDFNLAG